MRPQSYLARRWAESGTPTLLLTVRQGYFASDPDLRERLVSLNKCQARRRHNIID